MREYRIPNKILVYGMIIRMIFIIPEVIFERNLLQLWISEGVTIVVMLLIAIGILAIYEDAFGMGDIKLFAVMGAFIGVSGLFAVAFYSVMIAGLAAVILLITKKKSMKDGIKFAPYILVGTMVAFFVLGV